MSTPAALIRSIAPVVRAARRAARAVAAAWFPGVLKRRLRRSWESRWRDARYEPIFEPAAGLPAAVRAAIDQGRLAPGARVLDIGCGSGWMTAALAERGFRCVGTDFAQTAIDRARNRYGEQPDRLEWHLVDVTADRPPRNDFDVLIDRGCLHRIPSASWPAYCRHISAAARPGAQFLLFVATFEHDRFPFCDSRMPASDVRKRVEQTFSAAFEIEDSDDGVIETSASDSAGHVPAVVFWLRRKS